MLGFVGGCQSPDSNRMLGIGYGGSFHLWCRTASSASDQGNLHFVFIFTYIDLIFFYYVPCSLPTVLQVSTIIIIFITSQKKYLSFILLNKYHSQISGVTFTCLSMSEYGLSSMKS